MSRSAFLVAGLALASAHLPAQAPGALEGVFTVGAATPLGAWADQSRGAVQVGLGGRYRFGPVSLGTELLLVQGRSGRTVSAPGDGNLTTIGLVPQVLVPLFTGGEWQLAALAGFGAGRVSACNGSRTDLIPTTEGPQVSTYGGSTTWQTVRPMGMAGLGLVRGSGMGRRIGLEARWQQVATPGVRASTLSTCLLAAW